jgi:hypothetical protein
MSSTGRIGPTGSGPDGEEQEQHVSMEMVAWTSMYQAAHAQEEKRPFSLATLRRSHAPTASASRRSCWSA